MRRFLLFLTLFLMMASLSFAQQIIVVDRDGSFYAPDDYTDVWPFYQPVLDSLGFTYTYIDIEDPTFDGPDAVTMSAYNMAFWFTGEVWSDAATLTDNDEFNIMMYLTVYGGNLLLSAQDYLWDKYGSAGTLAPGTFPYDCLGLEEVEQDVWEIKLDPAFPDTCNAMGVAGSCLEGVPITAIDIFTFTDEGLWIDNLVQTQGQNMIEMTYPDPVGFCATEWDQGTYKSIFSTLSLGSIRDFDNRKEVMKKCIDWLMGTTGVVSVKAEQSDILVYPNPATTFTRIGCKDQIQEVWIMNSTGQVVDHMIVGNNSVKVNTSAYQSGIYFVKVATDKGTNTSRLIVQ
jgi:hypothetical protein